MRTLLHLFIMLPFFLVAQSKTATDAWTYNGTTAELRTLAQVLLNKDLLVSALFASPKLAEKTRSDIFISFPTPDGRLKTFRMFSSPVMPASLAQKYPDILTYTGIGLDNPGERVSVTVSNSGIKAMILGSKGNVFIDPIKESPGSYRVSYQEISAPISNHCSGCGIEDAIIVEAPFVNNTNRNEFPECVGEAQPCYTIGDTLVTYRFAGILTAEANNEIADGTVPGGMTWMNALVNQINLLWVRELGFRLELVQNNDTLVYTDVNPTPSEFTAYDMYVELPLVLDHITEMIGPGGYDTPASLLTWEYGAVFNVGYGGGLAYVPGSTSANIPSYDIFNHEIGHNLGSSHNCSTENGWRSTIGGTIMCWRGNTLSGSGGDQYSSHTIDIAIKYQKEMFWSSGYDYQRGWTRVATGNTPPTVSVPVDGFNIPKETPFVLEGNADNEFADITTFSWEQNDISNIAFESPNFPGDTGPLFCSADGTLDGYRRYFPNIACLLENQYNMPLNPGNDYLIEKLPFAEREINMRLLARDNNPYAGGFSYANIQLAVAGDAGPFRITSQDEAVIWETSTNETVSWDVANTTHPEGVNCAVVDIYLSIDGGENFNIVLAEAIANDGTENIVVPIVPTSNACRLMVKSADNIFFDINNSFFTIHNSAVPQLTIDTTSIDLSLPPDTVIIVEREISNNGEDGSVLTYDLAVEYNLNGAGYLSFDGSDDYVDLGTNLLSGSGDFSISVWVKTTGTDQVIIQQRNGGWNGEHQLRITGNGYLNFWTYSDGYQWSVTTQEAINDNVWHHIVVVQDEAFGGGRIYVDGEESASSSGGLVHLNGGFHSYLGADMRDQVNFLSGALDDIGIFSGALTTADVNALAAAGRGFNLIYDHNDYSGANHLAAFYPMNTMTGTTLFDLSGNGHEGFIAGPAWAGDLVPVPEWLAVAGGDGWLEIGAVEQMDITVNTTGLVVDAVYNAGVLVITSAETVLIPVDLLVNEELGTADPAVLNTYRLYPAYPNPFNPSTRISYDLAVQSNVKVNIYDILGRKVRMLVNGSQVSGHRSIIWNATNDAGAPVSAGIYLYTIETGEFRQTRKMVLLK